MEFGDLLAVYAVRVAEALKLLDEFLDGGNVMLLHNAAFLLTELGSETYAALAVHGQAILAALSIDAGLRLKERAIEIERRGLRSMDIEYLTDVRDILGRMVAAIESGEYERSYYEMVNKRGKSEGRELYPV